MDVLEAWALDPASASSALAVEVEGVDAASVIVAGKASSPHGVPAVFSSPLNEQDAGEPMTMQIILGAVGAATISLAAAVWIRWRRNKRRQRADAEANQVRPQAQPDKVIEMRRTVPVVWL